MAKKKKWARVLVWLISTESGAQNYVTTINKTKNTKIELKKYDPVLRKHVVHKSREKLK